MIPEAIKMSPSKVLATGTHDMLILIQQAKKHGTMKALMFERYSIVRRYKYDYTWYHYVFWNQLDLTLIWQRRPACQIVVVKAQLFALGRPAGLLSSQAINQLLSSCQLGGAVLRKNVWLIPRCQTQMIKWCWYDVDKRGCTDCINMC